MKEPAHLAATRIGDKKEFEKLTNPYRRELLVHCYRILGSLHDAEDSVQETMLRAWKRLDTFKEHISFRGWLYKIATNVCFDLLKKRRRRSLPTQEYPAANPQMSLGPPLSESLWLEPFPDARMPPMENDPEYRIIVKESVTLAFIATLQLLSAHQRAVLILRDVLGFRASEAAEILDLTVSAVNSLLHRARVNLSKDYDPNEALTLPYEDESIHKLLDQYRHAWETADVTALVALIKEDATFAMPPLSAWYQSREAILQFLDFVIFRHAAPGEIRLRPVRANGQPAFATYERNPDSGTFAASGIQLITIDIHMLQIANIISFRDAELVSRFDLPATI